MKDSYNPPRIQRGMHSSGFEGLHLGDQELRIRHFHSVLDRYIGELGAREERSGGQ